MWPKKQKHFFPQKHHSSPQEEYWNTLFHPLRHFHHFSKSLHIFGWIISTNNNTKISYQLNISEAHHKIKHSPFWKLCKPPEQQYAQIQSLPLREGDRALVWHLLPLAHEKTITVAGQLFFYPPMNHITQKASLVQSWHINNELQKQLYITDLYFCFQISSRCSELCLLFIFVFVPLSTGATLSINLPRD